MILYKINDPQFFGWWVGYILISLYRKFNNLEIDPITGENYDLTWEQTLKALIAPIRANPLIFIILCLIDLYCNYHQEVNKHVNDSIFNSFHQY